MRIILRYVLRSMFETKLRTILIIFTIMMSSAMFFASISISGTLVKMQTDLWRNKYGYSDIVIQSGPDSPSRRFYMNKAESYSDIMEYVIGEFSGFGMLIIDTLDKGMEGVSARQANGAGDQKVGVLIRGIDVADLSKLTPYTIEAEKDLQPFKGLKAVISSGTAAKYGLDCGNVMLLEINDARYRFIISGIFDSPAVFGEGGAAPCVIVPLKTLNSLYDARGRVDMIYLKLREPSRLQRMIYLLSKDYTRYTVKKPFSEWEIKNQTDRISAPIIIVTVILSFMCVYIIHTTFKIIVLERLPVIGTLRSIGASKRATDMTLLIESLIYGLAGGILGCAAGIGLLYAVAGLSGGSLAEAAGSGISGSSSSGGAMLFSRAGIKLDIVPLQLLMTVGLAVAIAAAGSVLSIIKAVRIPIREIIFGAAERPEPKYGIRSAAGFVILCLALVMPYVIPYKSALYANTACIVALLLSFSLLIPVITEHFIHSAEALGGALFGNTAVLAAKMSRKSKNMYSVVSMLMIGISSLYMIGTLNWSQIQDITACFGRNHYDLTMELPYADKNTLNLINETAGVEDALGCFYTSRTIIEGRDEPVWHILGVDTGRFLSFQDIKPDGNRDDLLEGLDKGRNILLTNTLKNRLGIKKGEVLTLEFAAANGVTARRSYTVTGFFDSIIKGKWSYGIISDKYFKLDVRDRSYGPILIKAEGDPAAARDSLKAGFSKRQPVIELKEDAKELQLESSKQLFIILQGFTVLTLFTGTFGIMNNMIIGLLQRKRQTAMLRSSGMSRRQLFCMMIWEAVLQGVIGSVLGVAAGFSATWVIVPQIIKALMLENFTYFSAAIMAACLAAGVPSCLLAMACITGGYRCRWLCQGCRAIK